MADYILIADLGREVWVAHDPNCPEVTKARAGRAPVVTMLDCEHPVTDGAGLERHACLRNGS